MTIIMSSIRRGSNLIRRFARQDTGMAAVEFALILPILVVLWLGGVEVTQGLSADRRLNNLASAIGDISARTKELRTTDIDSIFDLSTGAMLPFPVTTLAMRVTAVNIDEDGDAQVAWTRKEGTLPSGVTNYSIGNGMNTVVPESLRVADSQIIMSEVYYRYTPAVGYVISGSIELDDRMFFVPRLTQYVKLCDAAGANCVGQPS
jgi:Flp pilus assembly protein TadG